MNGVNRLNAINGAIWLRDNADKISRVELVAQSQRLAEYNVFSKRQIAKISKTTYILKHITKGSKLGGKVNPDSLENIRDLLFLKHANSKISPQKITEVLELGTSQGMLSKLTGISQSTISRSTKNV